MRAGGAPQGYGYTLFDLAPDQVCVTGGRHGLGRRPDRSGPPRRISRRTLRQFDGHPRYLSTYFDSPCCGEDSTSKQSFILGSPASDLVRRLRFSRVAPKRVERQHEDDRPAA